MACNSVAQFSRTHAAERPAETSATSAAHATRKRVTVVCHALSMESAVFVQEWDLWRQNGVEVIPCIGGKNEDGSIDVVVNALFSGDGGLKSVVRGDPAETTGECMRPRRQEGAEDGRRLTP